jgi:hypothetical protein
MLRGARRGRRARGSDPLSLELFLLSGGAPKLVMLGIALAAVPLSAAAVWLSLAPARRRPALLAGVGLAGLAAIALLVGLAAWAHDLRALGAAVQLTRPADRAFLSLEGASEARSYVAVGLAAAALPLGAAGFVAGQLFSRRPLLGGALVGLGLVALLGVLSARQYAIAQREWARAEEVRPAPTPTPGGE